jgi:hypothetical protein
MSDILFQPQIARIGIIRTAEQSNDWLAIVLRSFMDAVARQGVKFDGTKTSHVDD